MSEFREDLYYRLAVLSITLPPLRKRGEDLVIMSRFFLKQYAEESNQAIKGFTQEALEAIKAHDWPGNIRELVNTIRRAVVLSEGELITPADLGLSRTNPSEGPTFSLVAARERLEKDLIKEALSCASGERPH
jgi:DNA-binding NtrC family response regulator